VLNSAGCRPAKHHPAQDRGAEDTRALDFGDADVVDVERAAAFGLRADVYAGVGHEVGDEVFVAILLAGQRRL